MPPQNSKNKAFWKSKASTETQIDQPKHDHHPKPHIRRKTSRI